MTCTWYDTFQVTNSEGMYVSAHKVNSVYLNVDIMIHRYATSYLRQMNSCSSRKWNIIYLDTFDACDYASGCRGFVFKDRNFLRDCHRQMGKKGNTTTLRSNYYPPLTGCEISWSFHIQLEYFVTARPCSEKGTSNLNFSLEIFLWYFKRYTTILCLRDVL